MKENTILKKIKNRIKLCIFKFASHIRYISFSFLESNGIKNIGNLLFISNFKYNYQIIKFTKNDPTILNCGIESGSLVSKVAHMGNIAFRSQSKIRWNDGNNNFDNSTANNLIKPEYSNGWQFPSL